MNDALQKALINAMKPDVETGEYADMLAGGDFTPEAINALLHIQQQNQTMCRLSDELTMVRGDLNSHRLECDEHDTDQRRVNRVHTLGLYALAIVELVHWFI